MSTTPLLARAAQQDPRLAPLAERMRPRRLSEVVGQAHVLGEGRILARMLASTRMPSILLWGPPGVGKTSIAALLAGERKAIFETISATTSGIKDLRDAIARAAQYRDVEGRATILFVDEIHRFNKLQQDALLPHVERGVCTLVGATTENPSFEVNAALLSRLRVIRLRELEPQEVAALLRTALQDRERGLGDLEIHVEDRVLRALAQACQGDARRALNTLEIAAQSVPAGGELSPELLTEALGKKQLRYDKQGDGHYDQISALIKTMRNSDADGAVYWLWRILEAGEDPMFVARRLVIFASEDVGNADPQALVVASSAASATHLLGMPEAGYALTQATIYQALAPKSDTTKRAIAAAKELVHTYGSLEVPMHLRNAVTALMREHGYGAGAAAPHQHAWHVDPRYPGGLPEALQRRRNAHDAQQDSGQPLSAEVGRPHARDRVRQSAESPRAARSDAASTRVPGLPPLVRVGALGWEAEAAAASSERGLRAQAYVVPSETESESESESESASESAGTTVNVRRGTKSE